jgi:hypothetical protein
VNDVWSWHSDNVYSIMAVYGLALAYRRVDDDQGRACKCLAPFSFLIAHSTKGCQAQRTETERDTTQEDSRDTIQEDSRGIEDLPFFFYLSLTSHISPVCVCESVIFRAIVLCGPGPPILTSI